MSNSGSGPAGQLVNTTVERDTAFYDRLPRDVRRVVANAAWDFNAEQIFNAISQHPFGAADMVREGINEEIYKNSWTKIERRGDYVLFRRTSAPRARVVK
jgi:hypothetical protein